MSSYTNIPVCDLRHLTVEAVSDIKEICNVACLILPKDADSELLTVIGRVEKTNVAATLYLDVNDEITMMNGVISVGDGYFKPDGSTVMVINGLCTAKNLSKEAKGKIYLNGMMILPQALEQSCGLSFLMLNGTVKYLDYDHIQQSGTNVELDADMLSYLEPATLIIAGKEIRVAPDVTGEMLKNKQIILYAGQSIICHKNSAGYIKATATAGKEIIVMPDEQ